MRCQATDLKIVTFVRNGKEEVGGSHNWLLETWAVQCNWCCVYGSDKHWAKAGRQWQVL